MDDAPSGLIKQHLIDPEICIRCNTCEETCPIDAITHNDDNYVVDAEKCNYCMDCMSPCPTGAINNWRIVRTAWSIEDQFSWEELPAQEELAADEDNAKLEAMEDEAAALLAEAHTGAGGRMKAPATASKPSVNLYNRSRPAIATVTGAYRITAPDAETDVRHIILDFGEIHFPVLEGQSIGVVPPGTDDKGEPYRIRLYSIASPRHGERPNTNNLALTVKREPHGVCSNYLCDLKKGDKVEITGPFGATFLMPNDTNANIVMICTGTGSAPFRAFTEWRRRTMANAPGRMLLFFGARRPEELPYFGPLQKVPDSLLMKYLCFSRISGMPKTYVQDVMRREAETLSKLLADSNTHIYVCGLKGMEQGVDAALDDICRGAEMKWSDIRTAMRDSGRYHIETY